MKSSTMTSIRERVSARFALPAAALLLLFAAACPKPGNGPGTTSATGSSSPLKLNLTVASGDAQGRRSASVKFESSSVLPDGQLSFELPAGCTVVAGAAVRTVKGIGGATPVSQEIAFECPAGATGEIKASFKGTDAGGKPLEQSTSAKL